MSANSLYFMVSLSFVDFQVVCRDPNIFFLFQIQGLDQTEKELNWRMIINFYKAHIKPFRPQPQLY